MISIIMSTHTGRKDKCKQAIESVIAQTYQDWELIVVDDASTDGTEDMVKEFTDSRIKYLRRTECFGCDTKPKNEGISQATGEYISLLDSDNKFRPDHLQALYNEITTSGADLVYGDRMLFGDLQGMGVFHDFDPYLLMRRNYIDTSDVLVKRQVLIDVGGFDERYKKYIDWNLWVRLAKAGYKFKHVPIILTDYYVGKDTKSATKQDEKEFNVPKWDAFDLEIDLPYLHEVKEPKVAIFSLTYDRLEDTKICFESLYKTAKYPFDHFVVDNGSDREMVYYLQNLGSGESPLLDFISNKDNKGISIASNQALKLIDQFGPYDIIVKVDPDCLFLTDGWLKTMVEIWKSNHMMVLSPYIQGLVHNPGGAPRQAYGKIKDQIVGLSRHVGGICVFADVKAYDGFRWDENQPLHGVQDVEFSTWVRMHGYQCAYLESFFAEHIHGTDGQHERYPDYFKRREYEKSHAYGDKE